jgi:outer membrane protein assembly factor BamB
MRVGLFCAAILSLSHCFAGDWPQWRGPNRNGISDEQILTNWPTDGPKTLWRASVGFGFSSISISDGRAFTMGNSDDRETIFCFNSLTGKKIWQHTYPSKLGAVYHEGGPVSTPTVEGNRLYSISKWGDVFCLDAAKGTVIWEHDLRKDGVISNRWGFAGAPLILGDLVILNAGAAGSALDRKTGSRVWLNGIQPTGYASPVLYRTGERGDSVLIFGAKNLLAIEPATGKELWRFPWETGWDTNNPDPLIYRDQIFISSFSRGCALLAISNGQPQVVYDRKILNMHLSSGIVLGEYLYAFHGEAKQRTDFRCIDLQRGEVSWAIKDPAFGSLVCASDKLLILSEKGELLLGVPTPKQFKLLARAQVLGGLCWTPPALANGLLYLRNARGDLICLDLRTKT